tara:strand:+ start:11908 stop:15498 length:3591 start_codon:yes stop_codon:yes gene_type:complete
MAVTQNNFTGDNSTVLYNFTFPYLAQTDVKVKLDGVDTTAYSFANATTVQMNSAPASGVKVIVYRNTDNDNKKATFYPGSAIKAEDLNNNIDQILYVAQEVDNNALSTLGTSPMQGDLQLDQNKIIFEGATADAHETSIGVVDPTADRTINFPNVSGNVVTTGDTGTVTSAMITDATIVNADINASAAIAQSKLNIANATTSAAGYQSAADKTKLDGIETAATADQTNAEIRAAVEAASDSNVFTDADHTKLNNIETAATADQTAAEIRTLVGDASNSNVFTDADNTKLAGIETAATADQTASEIKTLIASSPLDASHLAADSVTTSELADAELTTLAGMQSGTASILASGTALTATNSEINAVCDGKTVQTTISDTDASYPTSGAVVDYVAAQIAPLGGLEVIANEDSFPTQPASGVVISIADAGGIVVNGSGVSTTARTSGNGSDNVTINGFPSTLHSTTLADSMGLLVSSTGSSNTYTYHKLLGKEDDIKNLSDDINDFNARYRIASSAPSSNNDDGDLYFDTTAKKMKVYNGATSQWDDVAQSSSSYIVTLSEAFDNSRTDFTMSTAATDAQSTIVSINGVIQKPNAGTSTPSEGFAISGNTLKLSNAPATGSTYFVVVLGDTVSIGTPSDNTVSTIKIQNLAVNTNKIAADAVDGTKIADDAVGAEHIEVLDANLQFADNAKAQFGTTNNDDLQIYHNGTHNYITNAAGKVLYFYGDDFSFKNAAADETLMSFANGYGVNLYHNDIKTVATNSNGITVQGPEGGNAEVLMYADEGDDNSDKWKLQVNSNTYFYLSNYGDGAWETNILAKPAAETQLYYDNSKKFETKTYGNFFTGSLRTDDGGNIKMGTEDDLQIYHDGPNSWINNTSGALYIKAAASNGVYILDNNNDTLLSAIDDAGVTLTWDNSPKFSTESYGCLFTDNVLFDNPDTAGRDITWAANLNCMRWENNTKACFGGGSELQIWHDGTSNWLFADLASTYALKIVNDGNDVNRFGLKVQSGRDDSTGTNYAISIADGDGTGQGNITFTSGTITYGPFTAHHPCIVPDSENPSDSSNAYPYGTLLETISIEYTQKNGANTERGIRYKVQKTQAANSKKVLGAYGSSMNGGPDGQTNEHQALILGDGHILVNNAGGNIEVGDGICSSATAGIGQKATANPSMIIGIAQEAITFTGSETKLVAVQYGLQQFIPWT